MAAFDRRRYLRGGSDLRSPTVEARPPQFPLSLRRPSFFTWDNALGERLASLKDNGEEAPQEQWQRFEVAARAGRRIMSLTPERRAQERDECEIAAKVELAEQLAVEVALTNISPGGVRLRKDEA